MRHRNSRNPQLFKEMQRVTQRKSASAVFLETQTNKSGPGEQRSVLTLLIFVFSYQLLQLLSFLLLHLLLPVFHVKLRGAETLMSDECLFYIQLCIQNTSIIPSTPTQKQRPTAGVRPETHASGWAPSAFSPPTQT